MPIRGIFEFVANQIGQFTLNLVGNPQRAGIIFRHDIPMRAASPALKATRDFDDFVSFHFVAHLDIIKVLQ